MHGEDIALIDEPQAQPANRRAVPRALQPVAVHDEAVRTEAEPRIEPAIVEEQKPRLGAARHLHVALDPVALVAADAADRRAVAGARALAAHAQGAVLVAHPAHLAGRRIVKGPLNAEPVRRE